MDPFERLSNLRARRQQSPGPTILPAGPSSCRLAELIRQRRETSARTRARARGAAAAALLGLATLGLLFLRAVISGVSDLANLWTLAEGGLYLTLGHRIRVGDRWAAVCALAFYWMQQLMAVLVLGLSVGWLAFIVFSLLFVDGIRGCTRSDRAPIAMPTGINLRTSLPSRK